MRRLSASVNVGTSWAPIDHRWAGSAAVQSIKGNKKTSQKLNHCLKYPMYESSAFSRFIKHKQYGGRFQGGRGSRVRWSACCCRWSVMMSHKSCSIFTVATAEKGMSRSPPTNPPPSPSHSHVCLPVIRALEQRLQMPLSFMYHTSCATTFHQLN